MLDLLARYQRDALHDPLSGLLNRRGFDESVALRARKAVLEGSLIACDIDHFKAINDQFGHGFGDRVIAAVAEMLNRVCVRRALSAPDEQPADARFGVSHG